MKCAKTIFGIATIVLFATCFARCWNYGIVDLDDYIYLLYHTQVTTWSGWESLRYFFTSVEEGIWMPLTWLSYALDYIMFGDWFGGFHLHSIFLHIVNACFVWWLLRILFSNFKACNSSFVDLACLLGALIWSVHPLRCESVVFLASRKDVLSFFWELLALICWAKGSRRNIKGEGAALPTAIAVLFFVIASMCKPSVMTFPVLCFLLDAFIFREVRIFRYIAPVAYMLFLGAFAAWQQKMGGATIDPFGQPLYGRILGAIAAFGIYIRNYVWPQWLAPQCVKTWPAMPRFLLPGLAITAAWGGYMYIQAMRYWDLRNEAIGVEKWDEIPVRLTTTLPQNFIFAGVSWFAIAIAPMLGIASFGYHSFADRFTYIPSVGLSIVIVAVLAGFKSQRLRSFAASAVFVATVAFAMRTWHQTGYWENDHKLFSHTIEVDGEHNGAAHGILANWYFDFPHDLDKSVAEFDKALERNINYVMPCYNIYIIALSESGQGSRIYERLNLYQEEVERQVGPDRAREIWNSDVGLEKSEQFYRSMYYCCKLAWNLADDDVNLQGADKIVSQLSGKALEQDPVWLYLLMKYHRLSGNLDESDRLRNLLLVPKGKVGYIQFRYLRDKSKDITL